MIASTQGVSVWSGSEGSLPSEPSYDLESSPTDLRFLANSSEGGAIPFAQVSMVAHSIRDSVERCFAKPLAAIDGVEAVFLRKNREFLGIWVVTNRPDPVIEDAIYTRYFQVMDGIPDYETDLCVLYRMDRALELITPHGSYAAMTD